MKMETFDSKEHFATWKHIYLCLAGIRIFCGMSDKIQKVTVDKLLLRCHTCKKCWQSIAESELRLQQYCNIKCGNKNILDKLSNISV